MAGSRTFKRRKCALCGTHFYAPFRIHTNLNMRHQYRLGIVRLEQSTSRPAEEQRRSRMRGVAGGSLFKTLGAAANAVLGFALVVVIARGYGPGRAGAFFEAVALFQIAVNLSELGADTGVLRLIPRLRELGRAGDVRPLLRIAVVPVAVLGSGLAVVLWVWAPTIAQAVAHGPRVDELTSDVRILAPFIPVNAVSTVVLSAAIGFGTTVPLVLVDNLGKPAIRPLVVATCVLTGLGAAAATIAWAGPILPGLVIGLLFLRRLQSRLRRRRPSTSPRALAGQFWRFSIPAGLAALLATGATWLDVLIVGAILSVPSAGIYTSVIRYTIVGRFLVQSVALVVSPHMSALLARGDRSEAAELYRTVTAWLIAMGWPIYLTLAMFAPAFARVFGSSFSAGSTALMIAALAGLFGLATGPVTAVLLMAGRGGWNLANAVGALALNVCLNLLLIPHLGVTGAGVAAGSSLIAFNLAALIQVRALERLTPFGQETFVAAAASGVCFAAISGIVRAVLGPTAAGLFAALGFALPVYCALLWRLREPLHLEAIRQAVGGLAERGVAPPRPTLGRRDRHGSSRRRSP